MKGVVVNIRPELVEDRLKVVAGIRVDGGEDVWAHLPDREVAAFLPRSVLIGRGSRAPVGLLETIAPILRRFTLGRHVRIWGYGDALYFCFPSWRGVRFESDAPASVP